MNTTVALALLAGLVIGLLIGFLAGRPLGQSQSRELSAQAREDLATARAEVAEAHAEAAETLSRLAAAEAQRDAAVERASSLASDRDSLADRFAVLSAETLERQASSSEAAAEQRLRATEQLMEPVRASLELLNRRIAEVERERASLSAQLSEQVRSVVVTGEGLRRETNALVTALRKPQVRGAWGETQLKRVAEITGMVERCDFETQVSSRTDDGALRPDMRINLSDGKCIFVDSKVPLTAFMDAFETEDPARREAHLATFARHVRTHVDQLSGKNYWRLDLGSPEMVVLFLPSEAFLQAAVEHSPDLQEYAVKRNIVLATPSILIPLLRAVQHGWKQAALAQSAAQVAALGRDLHERLGVMGSHMDKLGRSLTTAVKSYNQTVGSLETRVLVTARRFEGLEVTDAHIAEVHPVEEPVKQISAPELVENAGQVETIIGRALEREEREATRGREEREATHGRQERDAG